MGLSSINIEEINTVEELTNVAFQAEKAHQKASEATQAYANINDFPIFDARKRDDGIVHLQINSNDPITFSPDDWNNVVIHLRDVYFPEISVQAKAIRDQAIIKAETIINAE